MATTSELRRRRNSSGQEAERGQKDQELETETRHKDQEQDQGQEQILAANGEPKNQYNLQMEEVHEASRYTFIYSGYRAALSKTAALKSVFRWHNETMNIWTHLLPFLVSVPIMTYIFVVLLEPHGASTFEVAMFVVATLGIESVFFCSSLYHTMGCVSYDCHAFYSKFDYTAIAVKIVCGGTPILYTAFYCSPVWQIVYIGISYVPTPVREVALHPCCHFCRLPFRRLGILSLLVNPPALLMYACMYVCVFEKNVVCRYMLGAATVVIMCYEKFALPQYLKFRVGLFVGLGASMVVPLVHRSVFMPGFDFAILWNIILMGAVFIGGALLYANRFPERLFPRLNSRKRRWIDHIGHSHNIFHVCVVIGGYLLVKIPFNMFESVSRAGFLCD